MSIFVVQKKLHVRPDRCDDFEQMWQFRKPRLSRTPGFVAFKLIRNKEYVTEYIAETSWHHCNDFKAWVETHDFTHYRDRYNPQKILHISELIVDVPDTNFYDFVQSF